MAALLSDLYAVCGILACLFYLPQIRRLVQQAEARRSMSILTWGGWSAVGVVTLLYAVLVVDAPEMVVVAALNLACQGAVACLAVGQWVVDRRKFGLRC